MYLGNTDSHYRSGIVPNLADMYALASKVELADRTLEGVSNDQNANKFALRKVNTTHSQNSNTVVIIFAFYRASEKAIDNYCRIYHEYGFDALIVPSYLKHFAWPDISLDLAKDLLKFVKEKCSHYENIVVHAFSMGAYNFTVCMGEMYKSPKLYSCVENKIKAVIYDSLTIGTLENMARGVGIGVSKNNMVRMLVPLSMSLYFRLTSKYTVKVYDHYVDLFKQKPLQVPTLLFYCKNDPMSEYDVISELVQDWRKRFSFSVMDKSWEKSKHSAHLLQHRDEYTETVDTFLKSVPGLIRVDSKM